MEFQVTRSGTYCVLHISSSSVTPSEKELLSKKISALVEKEKYLALNLKKLSYANSQLLGLFLVTQKAMKAKKGTMIIVSPSGSVLDLLRITSMDRLFIIYSDELSFENAIKLA